MGYERTWLVFKKKNHDFIESGFARHIIHPFHVYDSMLFKVNLPHRAAMALNLF